MEATELDARTVDLRALSDLIDQVKQLIQNLNDIVSGVLGNALGTLSGLVDTIKAIKEQFLNNGLSVITDTIDDALEFIKNQTQEAAQSGIDISTCVAGKQEELEDLATSLAGELSDCVSGPVSSALEMVNNDLKIVGEITKNVTALPAQLTKCLISLRPITCVSNMLTSLTKIVGELPDQIARMIEEAVAFVDRLPIIGGNCVNGVSVTVNSKVEAIINEISKCIDDLKPEQRVARFGF